MGTRVSENMPAMTCEDCISGLLDSHLSVTGLEAYVVMLQAWQMLEGPNGKRQKCPL